MMLDSLSPDVRAAVLACCSMKSFKEKRFDRLVARYGLERFRSILFDEVYRVVVTADEERRRREREEKRRRLWSRPPCAN